MYPAFTLVSVHKDARFPQSPVPSPKEGGARCRGYLLTEVQLRDYFSQFGQILDVYLPHHKSGRNKGFGFTTFENELDLERVLRVGPPQHCSTICHSAVCLPLSCRGAAVL